MKILSRLFEKKSKITISESVPNKFPVGSFGGRGEHSILEGFWQVKDGVLTVRLEDSDFSDWGGQGKFQKRLEFKRSWPFDGISPSKEFLRDCILEMSQVPELQYYQLTEDKLLFLK